MALKADFITTKVPGASACVSTDHFVYVSAVAIDPAAMRRIPEAVTIADEMRHCLLSIEDSLGRAGCGLADIAKVSCYVSDEQYRMEALHAYRDHFGAGPYPSRGTVVAGLAGDCRVQLEVTAVKPVA
jgi:2-iminobutanoate/2-iminopropanoate deaminase